MAYFGGGKLTMGSQIVQFDPTPFINVVLDGVEKRLEAAGELFVERAKANFVHMSPPPSAPWQYPHIDPREETQMVDHIRWTVFDRGGDVVLQAGIVDESLPGRLLIYTHMLETGTRYMDPRPWLTITLDETWWELEGIMTGIGSL